MSETTAQAGDTVKVHYTGKLTDGTVFDSSRNGGEPLEFTVGAGQMIPGFDAGVQGMAVGENKTLQLEPDDAYGQRSDEAVVTVPKENLGDLADQVSEGDRLAMQSPEGQQIPVTVTKIAETEVTLDANHQLAGQTLVFDVELVDVTKGEGGN